ncbi:MAG: hypothetical protein ACRDRH_10600, partial [Pseudonocardia sp.]
VAAARRGHPRPPLKIRFLIAGRDTSSGQVARSHRSDAPTALPVTRAELGDAHPVPEDIIAAAPRAQLPWPIVADQLGVDRRRVQDLLDLDPALGQ